jgi:hypothetical protein
MNEHWGLNKGEKLLSGYGNLSAQKTLLKIRVAEVKQGFRLRLYLGVILLGIS